MIGVTISNDERRVWLGRIAGAGVLAILASNPIPTPALALDPIAVLAPSDVPAGYDNAFGSSVAISGDYIAVGARRDPWYNGDGTGAVYVFRRVGPRWIEQAKLTPSILVWDGQLGWSVDMDGDVIVAGEPAWEFNHCSVRRPGAAYVFRRNNHGTPNDPSDDTWGEEARLTAPDPEHAIGFGMSVAISGDVIVVGSDCANSAQVFRRTQPGWTHEATLYGSDPLTWEGFGSSVDVDAQRIVVGAFGYDDRRGAAYVFAFSNDRWLPEEKLTVSGSERLDDFGLAVAISQDHVVVGAPNVDGSGLNSNSGAAHVFTRSPSGEWTSQGKLTPSARTDQVEFGLAVASDGDLSLVASRPFRYAWPYDPWGYLFEHMASNWSESQRLFGVEYPHGVSLNGKYAVISTHIYVVRDRKSTRDFAAFQNCFSRSGKTALSQECQVFDFQGDGQLDLRDFAEFMATFGGP